MLEVTGHYHRALLQYLQELDIPVYVLHVQERPSRLAPPTQAAAQIRGMVHHRSELIVESTRRKNKLTAICDEVFPEFTTILKDPNGLTALAMRKRFPTPAALAAASLTALQEVRGKARILSDAKLVELQRLATQSIGTKDPARLRGLTFEQEQLIEELALIHKHLEKLEAEMTQIVLASREGKILLSIPGIGPIPAAVIIAMIGTIANFERPTQLKAYFGWAPTIKQSGKTLDRARLSPRGVRLMKQTMYLVAWQAIQIKGREWAKIYERLVPRKCSFDERTRRYTGRGKVIGRIAGQIISVIFTLLKKDQELLAKLLPGTQPPEPQLYDPEIHRQHQSGQYQPASLGGKPRKLLEFPPH